MKISVFKITYHTIREALEDVKDAKGVVTTKKGAELGHSSPETVVLAAQTQAKAIAGLPVQRSGVRNVVDQITNVASEVEFVGTLDVEKSVPLASSGAKAYDRRVKVGPPPAGKKNQRVLAIRRVTPGASPTGEERRRLE